jgi:methyl-accepting chemotaxis protein
MKLLDNAGVARKLWVFTVLTITALFVTAWLSQRSATRAMEEGMAEVERYHDSITIATEWKGLTQSNLSRMMATMLSTEPIVAKTFGDALKAGIERSATMQKKINDAATSEIEKKALQAVGDQRANMMTLVKKSNEIKEKGDPAAAQAFVEKEYIPAMALYLGTMDDYVAAQVTQLAAAKQAADAVRTRVAVIGLACMAVVVAAGLGFTALLARSICAPLARAVELSSAIAAGDLTQDVSTDRRDELGQLLRAMGEMVRRLRTVVGEIRGGVESVSTASTQIATGNTDLSQRTEEQASALQQTAATMDELGSTVRNTADSAQQANQLALGAAESATRGGAVVAEVVETMKAINDSAKKVTDIIGTIDSIAFQTNILALNAAVEAARAGEQGRGFAVVASEVRSLAQRSAEAAKEIKELIGGSVEQVERGTELVGRAGRTMGEIVDAIKRVSDIVGEISSATNEQSAGVGQVGQAVSQMDQATQQNAALVEESAAAAESLKVQASQLVEAVSVFKLAHDKVGVVPNSASVAAPARVERRGPDRAKNVTRPAFGKPKPPAVQPGQPPQNPVKVVNGPPSAARAGTDDWETF